MSRRGRGVALSAVSILLIAGCPPARRADVRGPATGSSQPSPGANPPPTARSVWSPVSGRLTASTRRRHLPANTWERTLIVEDLSGLREDALPEAWTRFGPVRLERFRLAGREGIEFTRDSSAVSTTAAGIHIPLESARVAGRDVRIEMDVAAPSRRRVQALGGVQVLLIATGAKGAVHELNLPVFAETSPSWETHVWSVRVEPGISAVRLQIGMHGQSSGISIGRLGITTIDPLRLASSRLQVPQTQPSAPVSLIPDGSFETGQPHFFTSAVHRWPSGDLLPVCAGWEFDTESAVGEQSLMLHVQGESTRVLFGPLNLAQGQRAGGALTWYLTFYARSAVARSVGVSLSAGGATLAQVNFQLGPEYRRYVHVFTAAPRGRQQMLDMTEAELALDFSAGAEQDDRCWLDAVALTSLPLDSAERYSPTGRIELGLLGPKPDPLDLQNLLDEGDPFTFGVRLVMQGRAAPTTAPSTAPAGQLAIDVLDGWDQIVWSRTSTPVLLATGVYNETVTLSAPRGYYRVLASLWSGEPGDSQLLAHTELSAAVVRMHDAVPLANAYGLAADHGYTSARTTHLGAGWVRMELPAARLRRSSREWDLDLWRDLVGLCRDAHLQYMLALTTPPAAGEMRSFMTQLLQQSPLSPLAIVPRPPAVTTRPVLDYAGLLSTVHDVILTSGEESWTVADAAAGPRRSETGPAEPSGADLVGFSCDETVIPEVSEPLLEEFGRRHRDGRTCDLGVPVRLGGSARIGRLSVPGDEPRGALILLREPPDPVVSASRMLRGILIRSLAGAEMVCCDALALAPPHSLRGPDDRSLHEPDLCPRPAAVAFDLLTSLLNDARLERWIDLPGGSRVLLYRRQDGGAVAAFWRPFGLGESRISFGSLPASVQVLDCTALIEPPVVENGERIVQANEVVRFAVAPAAEAALLQQGVSALRVLP